MNSEYVTQLVRGRPVSVALGEHHGKIDRYSQVERLERRSRVAHHLSTLWDGGTGGDAKALARMLGGREHAALSGSAQFVDRIAETFCIADFKKALAAFRRVLPSDSSEELTKLLNDDEFEHRHRQVQRILEYERPSIQEAVQSRIGENGSFARADQDAFEGRNGVSLNDAVRGGVPVKFRPEGLPTLLSTCDHAMRVHMPISEFIKNERMVDIGDHERSKISLAIHDLVDHIWFMKLLEDEGVLERHSQLLESICNPGVRRAFSRESEMFASIAFGVRYRHAMPHGMNPLIRAEVLLSVLSRHDHPTLDRAKAILSEVCRTTENAEAQWREGRAYAPSQYHSLVLNERAPLPIRRVKNGVEYASLSFAFSNYLTELDEQRRKHGKIKVFTGDHIRGELNPFSPAFISLFVEAHRELILPRNKHLDTLTAAHTAVESFLQRLGTAHNSDPRDLELHLSLDIIQDRSIFGSISPDSLLWMRRNPGFMAEKRPTI